MRDVDASHRLDVRFSIAVALTAGTLAGCGFAGASPSHQGLQRPVAATVPTNATPPVRAARSCRAAVRGWSTRRLAAEVVTVTADMSDVEAAEPAVAAGAGAVILFGTPPANLRAGLQRLTRTSPVTRGPLVMTDEEGGTVQRVAALAGSLPWPRFAARRMTTSRYRALVARIAQRMHHLGVTMDLGPVLDLSDSRGPNLRHPDGRRSFGIVPSVASRYGSAFIQGLHDGGVIATAKHFPGLGTATYNTDAGPARIAPLAQLRRTDLLPFQAASRSGVDAVMVSNASITGGRNLPVVFSRSIVEKLLRHDEGFHGLIVTDSLTGGAVAAAGLQPASAAVAALKAGVDLVIDGQQPEPRADVTTWSQTVAAITQAVDAGSLSRHRLQRAASYVYRAQHGSEPPGRPTRGACQ